MSTMHESTSCHKPIQATIHDHMFSDVWQWSFVEVSIYHWIEAIKMDELLCSCSISCDVNIKCSIMVNVQIGASYLASDNEHSGWKGRIHIYVGKKWRHGSKILESTKIWAWWKKRWREKNMHQLQRVEGPAHWCPHLHHCLWAMTWATLQHTPSSRGVVPPPLKVKNWTGKSPILKGRKLLYFQ